MTRPTEPPAPWPQRRVVVAGTGVSGSAAAEALLDLGATVTVLDEHDDADSRRRAEALEIGGAGVRLGPDAAVLPADTDLVVTSPGWRPASPLLRQAVRAGVPVWGEVELGWRLRPRRADGTPAPWLVVTGTNGKTTTVRMLDAVLRAAGLRSAAVGNIGKPVLAALRQPRPYDVLAVELSSFQLQTVWSMSARAAVVLNVAPDHLDWHGSFEAYRSAKAKVYRHAQRACVYPLGDAVVERLVRDADVAAGCRTVGFTIGEPPPGSVGLVDGALVDRAFQGLDREPVELASVRDISPPAPHMLTDALAAATLARAHGVPAAAVRDGLRTATPDAHRSQLVLGAGEDAGGVSWVDDSKATNPHAAAASVAGHEHVVWMAGGLAKGASFDELVSGAAPRLRAAVLLGRDRSRLAEALRRHAPDVPVIEVDGGETGPEVMGRAVHAASGLARPGDTVLLAPACASQDQFRDYGERGDAFVAAVRRLRGGVGNDPPRPGRAD